MSDNDWDLLTRYLAGNLSDDERARFERWLREAPGRSRMVAAAREVTASGDDLGDPDRRAAILASLRSRLPKPAPALALTFALVRPSRRMVALKWAAMVALVVGAGLGARYLIQHHAVTAERPVALRTMTTPAGKRAAFQLPDGSKVMLGPGSTLRYAADFGSSDRTVTLEGEAYFEVMHDQRRPFAVHAGDVVARDLGTEFTVRAYREEPHARVVVRRGRVALQAANVPSASQGQVIEPGQLGRIGADGNPMVQQVDAARYLAWTEGWLVFDRTPLREALPELTRWYDLDFRLGDDALGGIPLSGTFKERLSAEELDILAASLGLRQVRRDRVVTFYPIAHSR